MATCVIYIDEAGSPDRHDVPLQSGQTALFTLSALALSLSEWRARDREFLALKRQFFQDSMGREGRRDEEVEIKGRDLTYYLRDTAGAPDYSHAQATWGAINRLQFKSRQQVDGYQVFGYRVVDQRTRKAQPAGGDAV